MNLTHKLHIRPRILLVDDETIWRDLITALLKADYDIFTAESYDEGINILQNESIHLAVIDLRLESSNNPTALGTNLLKYASDEKLELPYFLILTGYPDVAQRANEQYLRNVWDVLLKLDFEKERFLEIVSSVTRQAVSHN